MLSSSINYNQNEYINLAPFTNEEINTATDLLRKGLTNALLINEKFESDFSNYMGVQYTLACCNGTAAMLEAMWACGVGKDTEVIAPAMTYWASVYPAYTLGAKVKYVDINPDTLCIDENQIESFINEKTKAIIVVHLYGHPCDMDFIMDIAKKHNLYVIEDFSHAHGAKYKNKLCGTIGHIGIASCMGEKPFPLPEGGVLCTNDQNLYERCCSFGHYRYLECNENGIIKKGKVSNEALLCFSGAPIGAIKNRMNPISAAIGIERLKVFSAQIEETIKLINYFIDLLERSNYYIGHRTQEKGSSMGGWYEPKVFVKDGRASEIAEKISLLGYQCYTGHKYYCLTNHIMSKKDFFREQSSDEDIKEINSKIKPITFKNIGLTNKKLISIPRFSKFDKKVIAEYALLYIKAAETI